MCDSCPCDRPYPKPLAQEVAKVLREKFPVNDRGWYAADVAIVVTSSPPIRALVEQVRKLEREADERYRQASGLAQSEADLMGELEQAEQRLRESEDRHSQTLWEAGRNLLRAETAEQRVQKLETELSNLRYYGTVTTGGMEARAVTQDEWDKACERLREQRERIVEGVADRMKWIERGDAWKQLAGTYKASCGCTTTQVGDRDIKQPCKRCAAFLDLLARERDNGPWTTTRAPHRSEGLLSQDSGEP